MKGVCVCCGLQSETGGVFCTRCLELSGKQKPAGGSHPAAEEGPETATLPPAPVSPAPAALKKILLIDDEPHILLALKHLLMANHYSVITALDGREGLKKALEEKPDLIISDVLMPHVTGYELVQQLEREAKGGRLIPVIIITAHPRMKDFFKSWEVAAFFEKPLDTGKLLDTIHSIVHYSR